MSQLTLCLGTLGVLVNEHVINALEPVAKTRLRYMDSLFHISGTNRDPIMKFMQGVADMHSFK